MLARLAVALGFAATLLAGQAMVFDSSVSAKDDRDPFVKMCEELGC